MTPGSPSSKCSSGCQSQRRCAVNAASCDHGSCGASFSTGLFLEENIRINLFLSFLAVGLWKRQSSTYHPAALCLLGWDLGSVGPPQMLVPMTDAGTHHLGQACGTQLLSAHQWVKHLCHAPLLKMHRLWHCKKEINAFPFGYDKCLLLLWVALLTL